jgi:hypothetical protein
MRNRKERLTVTVDPRLIEAGQHAVAAGLATSLSAWVSSALAEQVVRERRLAALAEAVAAYETEFGEISESEMRAQARADRGAAAVVRGSVKTAGAPRRS